MLRLKMLMKRLNLKNNCFTCSIEVVFFMSKEQGRFRLKLKVMKGMRSRNTLKFEMEV